jgi:hypothetical protein
MTPHLLLGSTSSQLAVSSIQADFEVRFYGDFANDFQKVLSYTEEKIAAIRRALDATGVSVVTAGVIMTLNFSFRGHDESPAAHILSTHLHVEVDESDMQDALARVAVRIRDTYFVTLTVSNYETRLFQRPILPGMKGLLVRPWEGTVDDVGIELIVDVNNNLEARTAAEPPTVSDKGIAAITQLLREVVSTAGPKFAATGELSVATLTEVSAV